MVLSLSTNCLLHLFDTDPNTSAAPSISVPASLVYALIRGNHSYHGLSLGHHSKYRPEGSGMVGVISYRSTHSVCSLTFPTTLKEMCRAQVSKNGLSMIESEAKTKARSR